METTPHRTGWVKLMRTPEAMDLLCHFPNAFRLAAIIAIRARWRDGMSVHGLAQGDCLLGDFESYGMTQKEYRGAKQKLQNLGFAAFKRATHGTIARLCDSTIFDVSPQAEGDQKGDQRAIKGRSKGDKRRKEDCKTEKKGGKGEPPVLSEFAAQLVGHFGAAYFKKFGINPVISKRDEQAAEKFESVGIAAEEIVKVMADCWGVESGASDYQARQSQTIAGAFAVWNELAALYRWNE